jgi:predicted metal-dependent phosphoesterase TrpH
MGADDDRGKACGYGAPVSVERRSLVRGAGAAALAVTAPTASVAAAAAGETSTVQFSETVAGAGVYHYFPFDVPEGVNRITARYRKSDERTKVGFGLFDHRGPEYGSDGFRGVFGEERDEFTVSAAGATRSFLPGPIRTGTHTIVLPVFRAPTPTEVEITIELAFGADSGGGRERAAPPGVLDETVGWYAGDLHCHTPHSSDAWASGTALSPREWADTCGDLGLDFAAITDHNVTSANPGLRRAMAAADADALLVPGEEMTNWFHGHATVVGIETDAWFDWRQRPAGIEVSDYEADVGEFFRAARDAGAYVAAAHPLTFHLAWQFFGDAELDPAARPHGLEVWNGPWTPDDEAALRKWDDFLCRGWRIFANGGSDTHGTDDPQFGQLPGIPTTVTHASELSPDGIAEALKAGRAYVTESPDGPALLLTATGPAGHTAMVGGELAGAPEETVNVSIRIHDGAGSAAVLVRNGEPVHAEPVGGDDDCVEVTLPIAEGGYVRAELRGQPEVDLERPLASHGDVRALTNPIFVDAEGVSWPADAARATGSSGQQAVEERLAPRRSAYAACHRREI